VKLVFALILTWGVSALAIYEIGDAPGNACWTDLTGKKVCLADAPKAGFVSVLLFNAGWCAPCNAEFKELVPAMEKFAGKNVVFISLSSDGFGGGGGADEAFLKSWSKKFGIGSAKASWVVAASPHNAGRDYFRSPSIPNAVILGADGKVFWKAVSPGVRAISAKVEAALKP